VIGIPLQPSAQFDTELFERRIREYASEHDGQLKILEAGCGRMWSLHLEGVNYWLTGLDLDERAMKTRMIETGDLDEAIVGDLRTAELPPDFDIIFSSFVLEHVHGAEQVLDRLVDALRPGGLLLIRIPDRDSVWGFVARTTPHWLHVQYKRRIRRRPLAGTPGRGPYPAVYDRVVSATGISRYAEQRGLRIEDVYASNSHLSFFGRLAPVADLALRVIARFSFGRLTARYSNLAFVLRKVSVAAVQPDAA
jgi:SAM-dependent methyltransferase